MKGIINMICIFAEKPNMGAIIAAALDGITLSSGKKILFSELESHEKLVKSQQFKEGYLKIRYNSEDCYVTWGYGHLCELKQAYDYNPEYSKWTNIPLPYIPKQYDLKVKENVTKQFNIVKNLFLKSTLIINATDYDREGEVIFSYLYDLINPRTTFKRAHFTSQTQDGIIEGFQELKSSDEVRNMTDAGRARSIADWLIGSNLTVATTLKYSDRTVLSIGRVQTPTLNLFVERELAIQNFVPMPYYTVSANFTLLNGLTYKGEHISKRFENKTDAQYVLNRIKDAEGIITSVEVEASKKNAPILFSLASLQMEANSRYGFTITETLEIAQYLYEKGYTTYPRTNSNYLTEDMELTVNKVLNALQTTPTYGPFLDGKPRTFNKKAYFNNSMVSSHFAIIPTGVIPTGLNEKQSKLYDLIAKSIVMMVYSPAIIQKTTVLTDVNGEVFKTSGNIITDCSWMEVWGKPKEALLPSLLYGDVVNVEADLADKFTTPPKRYNDKTIISAMLAAGKELDDEELRNVMVSSSVHGIGTDATRPAIIDTLINRGYITRDKKNIYATEKGISLIKIIPFSEIKSAELTAMWEGKLNDIALGKLSYVSFIKEIEALTTRWCSQVINSNVTADSLGFQTQSDKKSCPLTNCSGKILSYSWGWGCSNYKCGCKFSVNKIIAGKELTDKQLEMLVTTGSTKVIRNFKGKKGMFDAKLKLEDNRIKFDFTK